MEGKLWYDHNIISVEEAITMKKILAFLLSLIMLLSLAACGEEPLETPKMPEVTGERVLTIGLRQSSKVQDYDNNWFTKFMEERLDIDLQFMFFSGDAVESKNQLAAMVAGGEKLPDILFNFSLNTDEIHLYGQDGYFADLAPYFDDPEWELAKQYRWHEKMTEFAGEDTRVNALNSGRTAEGAMYYWPSAIPTETDRLVTVPFINVSWLDKLGLEMPTTLDELEVVLQAFKTQDPNGNGIADEIPMIGSTKLDRGDAPLWIVNHFGEYINDLYFYTYDGEGKIQAPYTTEGYRSGIRKLREWVEAGLLSPLTWSMKEKAELTSLWTPSASPTTAGVIFGDPTAFTIPGDEDILQYEPLPPLKDSHIPLRANMGNKSFYITTDCEKFDLAAEFLMSFTELDVARACRRGEEGVDWTEATDTITGLPMVNSIKDVFGTATDKTWAVNGPYVGWYGSGSPWSSGEFEETAEASGVIAHRRGLPDKALQINVAYAREHAPDRVFASAVYTVDEADENGNSLAECKTYVKEARAKFATGQLDINSDADWNDYLATLERIGLPTLIQNTQTAVDRMSK